MHQTYQFEALPNRYLTDSRIKSAVDELASRKMISGFNPQFEYSEFPDYVQAWLSAQQTVADWANMLHELWDQIWGASFQSGILYVDRMSSNADLSDGGIFEAWTEGWHGRHVQTKIGPIQLVVYSENNDFWLQVEFEEEGEKFSLTNWKLDDYELDSPKVSTKRHENQASLNLTDLRDYAREALGKLGC